MSLPVRLPRSSMYPDGQIISGDVSSASAISFRRAAWSGSAHLPAWKTPARSAGNLSQRCSLFSQARDNIGGVPVGLHHAGLPSITCMPSAVRIQRGAFRSAAKYQTSSHSSPVSVVSVSGSSAWPFSICVSARQ